MSPSKRSTITGVLLAASVALAAAPAGAAEPAEVIARRTQASNYFDAGAEAFKAGQYLIAAEAFEKAYATMPSTSLLFSAAQAYRRQYVTAPSPPVLQRAIALYREYLKGDPKANRREDAMEALQVLVPLDIHAAATAAAEPKEGTAPGEVKAAPAAEAGRTARVLLSAGIDGAEVAIDDGPFLPAPVTANVEPKAHRVRVRASGYHDEELSIDAVANELLPRHVALRPKAARLEVTGTSGARIAVDGQVLATVPNKTPIALEPGPHFVAVTLAGREPVSRRIEAGRDQAIHLQADLPLTRQRIGAWATLALGGAGAVATGVLTGLTFSQQSAALTLSQRPAESPLTPAERDDYNRARQQRNELGQAAGITAGISALVLATGVGLFVLDEPDVVLPDAQPGGPVKSGPRTTFEVGLGSAALRVVF